MNANHARRMPAPLNVSNKDQLFAADERRDCALCGCSLAEPGTTRFAKQGAHDPTPTPYFILENLFSELDFSEESHLLDVGCGTGRVLSFFIQSKLAGHATGIELDPDIAEYAQLDEAFRQRRRTLRKRAYDSARALHAPIPFQPL